MMKHAPEFLAVMERLEPLLREGKKYCVMPYGLLCDWIAYFWNRGTISYAIGEDGIATGVCLIKLFDRLEYFLEPFIHEPGGDYCFVELLVSRDPVATASMYQEFVTRWGKPKIMMWDREERTQYDSPRMYTWDQYEKLTRRLTYGLIDKEKTAYGFRRR